jgi:hypothetical protein
MTKRDRKQYDELADGEWFAIPRIGEKIACCDCGLVHLTKISRRGGKIGLRFWRMGPETGGIRASLKITRRKGSF